MKKRLVMIVMGIVLAMGTVACGDASDDVIEVEAELKEAEEDIEDAVEDVEEDIEEDIEAADIDEEDIEEAAEGVYASLADWIASEEGQQTIATVNEQLGPQGLTCDMTAEGTVFVLGYTFTEQQDLSSLSKDEVYKLFDESVAPALIDAGETMADAFADEYGLDITALKCVINNADGTEIYNKTVSGNDLNVTEDQ